MARNCVECGRDIPVDAETCPFCGHDYSKSKTDRSSALMGVRHLKFGSTKVYAMFLIGVNLLLLASIAVLALGTPLSLSGALILYIVLASFIVGGATLFFALEKMRN